MNIADKFLEAVAATEEHLADSTAHQPDLHLDIFWGFSYEKSAAVGGDLIPSGHNGAEMLGFEGKEYLYLAGQTYTTQGVPVDFPEA